MAFMALLGAETAMHPTQYRKWAKSQIGYTLGDTGRSFVVGYGVNPPTHPSHRGRLELIVFHIYIRVITKLPNSEQSSKGKVKTHKYINRQNQSTTANL